MLNLLDCKIKLARSTDYAKLVLLIYLSSSLLLFYSACPLFLKITISLLLLAKCFRIITHPIPHPNYLMLSYKEQWLLLDKNQQTLSYDKARVVIDTGLFFLLELSGGARKKLIVIFLDQIDEHNYRLLNIIKATQHNVDI
ncbi:MULTISPECIES: protein YgfX [Legionella]|uniref:Uncharacterized protein n=1 Tax=Legionella drozanskii LLAP-1 TaxID=1212489 RepID=A0A0W0TDT7_9GAMM|nr:MULTISPECIES: protein YgfX [Legionella]KTC93722.1 hypothetical protein Ldro_0072 [Legionella drozanskii LLAP-1]